MTHTTPGAKIVQAVSLSRDATSSGRVQIDLEYDIDEPVTAIDITLPPSIEIEHAHGFAASGSTWRWDGATHTPRLSGRYEMNDERAAGAMYVDAGEWAILKAPGHAASWQYRGVDEIEFVRSVQVAEPGVASPDGAVVFLGDHDVIERHAGQPFTLVVPAAATMACSPAAVFNALADLSSYLDVGGYQEDVLLIAAPSAAAQWGPLGTQTGDSGFWALDRCRLDEPNSTWLHEYVHTRQAPSFEPTMEWFTEGTACYYATYCSMARGDLAFDTGHQFLATTTDRTAILSTPTAWPSAQTKYTKGRRVVAALDCELRQHTNGQDDLRTVWAHLNATCETAGYQEFLAALRTTIPNADPIVEWCTQYIDGPDSPPVPSNPAAFGIQQQPPTAPGCDNTDGSPNPEEPTTEPPEAPPTDDTTDPPTTEPTDDTTDPRPDPPTAEPAGRPEHCPVCETSLNPDAAFCETCGTAVDRTCHICGAAAPGQQHCPECGTKLIVHCDICGTQAHATMTYCARCGNEFTTTRG